jgi:tetratricopeptide (TPR) repeat protein
MKTKITLLLIALFVGFNTSYGQQDEECMNNLSIFDTSAKNKKYDDAYEPWMIVRGKCPQLNRAIYVHGQKILNHKIKNSSGAEKATFIKDLIKLDEEYDKYFASKYPIGKMLTDIALLTYKYKKDLDATDEDVYNIFDKAYNTDLKNFKSAQGLYIYFSIEVDMFDAKKRETQHLFDKYDDVKDKIESEINGFTEKLNKLLAKEEAGTTLTRRETSLKKNYEQNLEAFDMVSGSIDTKIGNRATCEVLIPLYQKDFEEFKNDAQWLQRAMNKLASKECTDDPMFVKVLQQKNMVEPNADTSYYLGFLKEKEGKSAEAEAFYKQSLELQTEPLKKAKLISRLAEKNYKKGSFGKARQYYMEALKLNPSNGAPYLRIAAMYAKSANKCGDTQFNKRAVYWLAAAEARKAGKVDARLKKAAAQNVESYLALAPSKSDVFSCSCAGTVIKIGCWIGRSVMVPKN